MQVTNHMQRGTDQNQFTTTLLSRQISFIKEIDRLKYIQRRTKLFNSDRRENDAEHSWHLAMMALVLAGRTESTGDY